MIYFDEQNPAHFLLACLNEVEGFFYEQMKIPSNYKIRRLHSGTGLL